MGERMIVVEHIQKIFDTGMVLRDVSFSLKPGELVGLVGPSGGGKSVLLKILGKVLEPTSGSIRYCTDAGESNARSVGFLFQEGALFDSMTVLENVAFPLQKLDPKMPLDKVYERSYEILAEVGLAKAYQKLPGQLSGGMRRRVGIARALVHRPELVLLDDPTGGLDPVAASVIIDLIKSLHRLYLPTVVLVSHDIRRLLPNVERVLGLFDGVIRCDASPAELTRAAPQDVVSFLATRFDFSIFGESPRH